MILDMLSSLVWASSLTESCFSCFTVKILKDLRVMVVARERSRLVPLKAIPTGRPTPLANAAIEIPPVITVDVIDVEKTYWCPCYHRNKTWWFVPFPTSQFLMKGSAKPFRLDRNRKRGGVMIYIWDDIPCRLLLEHVFPSDIEGLYIELNFRKCKWLLLGKHHPPSQYDQYYFNNLDKSMDTYRNYEKFY